MTCCLTKSNLIYIMRHLEGVFTPSLSHPFVSPRLHPITEWMDAADMQKVPNLPLPSSSVCEAAVCCGGGGLRFGPRPLVVQHSLITNSAAAAPPPTDPSPFSSSLSSDLQSLGARTKVSRWMLPKFTESGDGDLAVRNIPRLLLNKLAITCLRSLAWQLLDEFCTNFNKAPCQQA